MKFRKKPIVVEAWQLVPSCKIPDATTVISDVDIATGLPRLFIETLEGRMEASLGDWIITGVKGEHYPCKPDIFEMTYEPVEVPR